MSARALQKPYHSIDKSRCNVSVNILEKERRWNENCINQKQKLYAKRYHLQPNNIYNSLFHHINEKIRFEIEINAKRIKYDIDSKDGFYVLKKYSQMYNKSSKEVLKLFKSQQTNKLKPPLSNNMACMQLIKKLDIKQLTKKKSLKPVNTAQSRICKTNSVSRLGEKCDKLTDQLRSQSYNLKKKLENGETRKLEPLPVLTGELPKYISKTYSKNAYLASLNYDFTDPLS